MHTIFEPSNEINRPTVTTLGDELEKVAHLNKSRVSRGRQRMQHGSGDQVERRPVQ